MTKKSVYVTLYHATWCGHCVRFMPEWERLKGSNNVGNNIDFVDYESSAMASLDPEKKTINGNQIGGFPTIKISVSNNEYEYDGERNARNILKFIKTKLEGSTQKGGCGADGVNHVNGCNCARESDRLTEFT